MAASLGRSYEWDAYEDVDKPSSSSLRGQMAPQMAPQMGLQQQQHRVAQMAGQRERADPQCYSNEALVDGDEYFSDQTDYEEHYLAKRQRQDSGTSLTSRHAREPPVGASPVHAAPGGCPGAPGYEGIATYEQRRLMSGKSMPQLNERPQPQPRHRYESIPQRPSLAAATGAQLGQMGPMAQMHPPPQQPPPPPHRPTKGATPTRRSNSSVSGGTPPRRSGSTPPSATSLARRGGSLRYAPTASTPTATLSSPATSPLRLQQQQQHQKAVPFVSPSTSRRNLTPLMNSMSPQPLPRTPRQHQQQHQQYNHRRTASMSSGSHQKTAVIAPNSYTGYDLSGRAYGDGSRPRCELEDDMAEMQASFLSQQHEPLMRRSPRRKSLSPGPSTPLSPPSTSSMDMQQLACSRGAMGPAVVRSHASPACSPSSYKSNKSSWLSLPGLGPGKALGSKAPRGVLFGTGIVLIVSGVAACVMSFYMLSQKGRQYYLDFGVLSAFASLMLGLVGLRSRVGHLLPNRNYVTGYILVAAFSVLTAAGLLALLLLPPPPHLPRSARLHAHGLQGLHGPGAAVDMTAGAVCGTAALTLLLAATGTLTSYCCRYPPPDNRVAHAAEGFSV